MSELLPSDTPPARKTLVTCEFCECTISQAGEIVKRSNRARGFLDLDDDNAKLRQAVESKDARIAELTARVSELERTQAAPAGAGTGGGSDDDNW